jgi:hypothetical protein
VTQVYPQALLLLYVCSVFSIRVTAVDKGGKGWVTRGKILENAVF